MQKIRIYKQPHCSAEPEVGSAKTETTLTQKHQIQIKQHLHPILHHLPSPHPSQKFTTTWSPSISSSSMTSHRQGQTGRIGATVQGAISNLHAALSSVYHTMLSWVTAKDGWGRTTNANFQRTQPTYPRREIKWQLNMCVFAKRASMKDTRISGESYSMYRRQWI